MSAPAVYQIGQHVLRIEEDTIFLQSIGKISLEESKEIHTHIAQVIASLGRVFIVNDVLKGDGSTPEARRYIAEWNKQHKASGAVVYGAGIIQRAMATLVFSAIRLFRSDAMPFAFVKDEAEARLWVSEQRQKLLGT